MSLVIFYRSRDGEQSGPTRLKEPGRASRARGRGASELVLGPCVESRNPMLASPAIWLQKGTLVLNTLNILLYSGGVRKDLDIVISHPRHGRYVLSHPAGCLLHYLGENML